MGQNLVKTFLFIFLLAGRISFVSGVAQAGEPFAVVELFGSEGCSSCPAADELLSALTQSARSQNINLYPLSFHVDYWNDLGWEDPYSQAQFTQRQYQYAQVLQNRSVYTPQMIVNGTRAFVGSDEQQAQKWIQEAFLLPSKNQILIQIVLQNPPEGGSKNFEVIYKSLQMLDNAVIHFALVERGLKSHVTRGENAGHVLKHDNIVREFKTIPFKAKQGRVSFPRPQTDDLHRFSVIAYVQDRTSMKIIAAHGQDFISNVN